MSFHFAKYSHLRLLSPCLILHRYSFVNVAVYVANVHFFFLFSRHIKPFHVKDDSTNRLFVQLLLIVIVGKLFTAGYHSTAVALECEV
jgi:hypothetical protein